MIKNNFFIYKLSYKLKQAIFYILSFLCFSFVLWQIINQMPGSFMHSFLAGSNTSIKELEKPTYFIWLHNFILLDWGDSLTYKKSVFSLVISSFLFSMLFAVALFIFVVPMVFVSAYFFNKNPKFKNITLYFISLPSLIWALLLQWLAYQTGFNQNFIFAYIVAFNGTYWILLRYLLDLLHKSKNSSYAELGILLNLNSIIFYKDWLLKPILPNYLIIIFQNFSRFFASMLVIETMFDLPGLSNRLYNSILNRDYDLIMAINVVIFIAISLTHFLAEEVAFFMRKKYEKIC